VKDGTVLAKTHDLDDTDGVVNAVTDDMATKAEIIAIVTFMVVVLWK
jgi:hypothetical protein